MMPVAAGKYTANTAQKLTPPNPSSGLPRKSPHHTMGLSIGPVNAVTAIDTSEPMMMAKITYCTLKASPVLTKVIKKMMAKMSRSMASEGTTGKPHASTAHK